VFFCVTILVQNLFSFYWALGIFLFLTVFVAGFGLFFTDWFEHKFIFLNPITTQLSQIRLFLPSLPSVLHPNEVAGTLLWGLPILVVLPFARWNFKSRWQCVLFVVANSILLLLVLFSFLLMQSRAGYLALLLTFVLMVVLAIGTYRVYGVRIKLFFLSAFVAIGLGSLVFWKQLLPLFEKMMSYFPFEASSINRMEIWSSAMYAIKDFPLTGMGMNTFRSVAPFMYPLFVNLDYDIAHAHNEFLHVAVDLGLLGLIAFVSIYILAFYMLFQLFNHSIQNPHDTFPLKAVVFGLGGGLFAHLLWGMVDAIALGAKPGFLFWMLLGLISALYTIYQDKDKKLKELNHAG
jgi:O-antigen ligase